MYVAHDVSACVECEMCDCEYMYARVCVRSDAGDLRAATESRQLPHVVLAREKVTQLIH